MNGVELFCGPDWFTGIDLIIDFFSLVVLAMISIYAFKVYNLYPKKTFKAIGWAMSLIAGSFLFKIITYSVFYLRDNFSLSYRVLSYSTHGFFCTEGSLVTLYFIYALIDIIGLFVFLMVYQKNKSLPVSILTIYLIVLSLIMSSNVYYLFHLTSFVILILISSTLLLKFKKNKSKQTQKLFFSFSIITMSHVFFLISSLTPIIYVLGELVLLIGYIGLLWTFESVLHNGKKTRKTRHN